MHIGCFTHIEESRRVFNKKCELLCAFTYGLHVNVSQKLGCRERTFKSVNVLKPINNLYRNVKNDWPQLNIYTPPFQIQLPIPTKFQSYNSNVIKKWNTNYWWIKGLFTRTFINMYSDFCALFTTFHFSFAKSSYFSPVSFSCLCDISSKASANLPICSSCSPKAASISLFASYYILSFFCSFSVAIKGRHRFANDLNEGTESRFD